MTTRSNTWLTIVGMGEDGWEGISNRARLSIKSADVIIGTERLIALLPKLKAEMHDWPQPFSAVVEQIKGFAGRKTVLLATGDPMNFGVARKVLEFLPKAEVEIIPHVSAFSLAAARMGWSLPDLDCLTIHGRPAAHLESFIQPEAKLFVLTQDETSIAEACRRLIARGFENSHVTVLENIGGANARVTTFAPNEIPDLDWSPLNVLAIKCITGTSPKIYARLAGLPDDAFVHDGQMTKREVRAATLASLAPAPGELLWDIGAGCGSVAIEWMRSTRGCLAIAFEPNEERLKMIATNADQLGTPRLKIVQGNAPACYAGQSAPDAIFIGGGIADIGVFEDAWAALKPEGRMVANVVTLEGDTRLFELFKMHGGEIVRIDISTLTTIGDLHGLRPRMSVLQWRVKKP